MESVSPEAQTDEPAREPEPRRRRRRRDRPDRSEAPPAEVEAPRVSRGDAPEPTIYERPGPAERVDPDAVKVIRRLRRHGYDAYLVGGGVRDLLLGLEPKDFDIATSARPNDVRALFRNCRVIGRRFRLAHVLFAGGKVIEVATFRRDPLEDEEGARPDADADLLIRHDNVFGEPHEDAVRRDFTINGLFYDTEAGTVIDYVGGMADLEQRVVRTIGAPDVRFREDPVRILRAIKFSARLDLGIDPDVYDAMVAQRTELARAARPRLLEELLRLLRSGAAHRSYWLMWETGALSVLLPPLAAFLDDDGVEARQLWSRLGAIDTLRRAAQLPSDAVLLAALLLGPILEAIAGESDPVSAFEDFVDELVETLAVPRRMKERVRQIIACQDRLWAGRLGTLPRRDYFEEAVQLFAIELDARGERRPDWMDEPPDPSDLPSAPRRRRRRRR